MADSGAIFVNEILKSSPGALSGKQGFVVTTYSGDQTLHRRSKDAS
jgi:hypothetical protein